MSRASLRHQQGHLHPRNKRRHCALLAQTPLQRRRSEIQDLGRPAPDRCSKNRWQFRKAPDPERTPKPQAVQFHRCWGSRSEGGTRAQPWLEVVWRGAQPAGDAVRRGWRVAWEHPRPADVAVHWRPDGVQRGAVHPSRETVHVLRQCAHVHAEVLSCGKSGVRRKQANKPRQKPPKKDTRNLFLVSVSVNLTVWAVKITVPNVYPSKPHRLNWKGEKTTLLVLPESASVNLTDWAEKRKLVTSVSLRKRLCLGSKNDPVSNVCPSKPHCLNRKKRKKRLCYHCQSQ